MIAQIRPQLTTLLSAQQAPAPSSPDMAFADLMLSGHPPESPQLPPIQTEHDIAKPLNQTKAGKPLEGSAEPEIVVKAEPSDSTAFAYTMLLFPLPMARLTADGLPHIAPDTAAAAVLDSPPSGNATSIDKLHPTVRFSQWDSRQASAPNITTIPPAELAAPDRNGIQTLTAAPAPMTLATLPVASEQIILPPPRSASKNLDFQMQPAKAACPMIDAKRSEASIDMPALSAPGVQTTSPLVNGPVPAKPLQTETSLVEEPSISRPLLPATLPAAQNEIAPQNVYLQASNYSVSDKLAVSETFQAAPAMITQTTRGQAVPNAANTSHESSIPAWFDANIVENVAPTPLAVPPRGVDPTLDQRESLAKQDDIQDEGLGTLTVSAQPKGPPEANTPPPRAQITAPADLHQQLLAHAETATDRQVDLALTPDDLGHIKFQIRHYGDAVTVMLSAERAETLDMLKRHSEELLREFRTAGFAGATLDFGRWGQQQQSKNPPAAFSRPDDVLQAQQIQRPSPAPAPQNALHGLNIRL